MYVSVCMSKYVGMCVCLCMSVCMYCVTVGMYVCLCA